MGSASITQESKAQGPHEELKSCQRWKTLQEARKLREWRENEKCESY